MTSHLASARVAIFCTLLVEINLPSRNTSAADTVPARSPAFRVGYAEQDITPPPGLPMWGYGARHALTATGALDLLFARVVVIHAGTGKLAIMGLDLGRAPTAPMMEQIRAAVQEQAGIEHVLISGSHTHHGPVIELVDREGFGKGTFDAAVKYSQQLPGMLINAILTADRTARPARMGISSRSDLNLNRNRQSKREPKARDPMLAVMRFDNEQGEPLALLANFAAHPVMTDTMQLRYSADYPGFLVNKVREDLGCGCVFMQGAAGDMSVNPPGQVRGPKAYGELLATYVVELAKQTESRVPDSPSVAGRVDSFHFRSRVNLNDPLVRIQYSLAFFPELIQNMVQQFGEGIDAELNTVVLNGNVALVGGSGEFFCNHANRLKERTYLDHTLFFGYCNGHSLYFPTIEAVSEGGYGADAPVSPVEIGAGEQMLNRALINIYELLGRIDTAAHESSSDTTDDAKSP
ncbi:MAG: neutral/alkaline non-lysosomal ceramidase N-terminal domain-containing protein [Planctomycetaceae bacterium]